MGEVDSTYSSSQRAGGLILRPQAEFQYGMGHV